MKTEFLPTGKIKAHPRNSKKHNQDQIDKIVKSLGEFEYLNLVVVDEENTIIAGHARYLAAKELGWDEIEVIRAEGLTEAQKRAFLIAENKLQESDWDQEILREELNRLKEKGYDTSVTGYVEQFATGRGKDRDGIPDYDDTTPKPIVIMYPADKYQEVVERLSVIMQEREYSSFAQAFKYLVDTEHENLFFNK